MFEWKKRINFDRWIDRKRRVKRVRKRKSENEQENESESETNTEHDIINQQIRNKEEGE